MIKSAVSHPLLRTIMNKLGLWCATMVKEARELARAKGADEISPATLEGFAAAKVLVESLRRAGLKPNREKIEAALEGMRKLDIGGLKVNYSAEDHTGLDFADPMTTGPPLRNRGRFPIAAIGVISVYAYRATSSSRNVSAPTASLIRGASSLSFARSPAASTARIRRKPRKPRPAVRRVATGQAFRKCACASIVGDSFAATIAASCGATRTCTGNIFSGNPGGGPEACSDGGKTGVSSPSVTMWSTSAGMTPNPAMAFRTSSSLRRPSNKINAERCRGERPTERSCRADWPRSVLT